MPVCPETTMRSAVAHFGRLTLAGDNSILHSVCSESHSLESDMVSILLHQHAFQCPFDTANVYPGACRRQSQARLSFEKVIEKITLLPARLDPFLCRSRRTDRNMLRLVTRLFVALNDDKCHWRTSKDVSCPCYPICQHRPPGQHRPRFMSLSPRVIQQRKRRVICS